MKCPHCGAWTELRVRETRTRQDGSKRRTYVCGNEHTFTTVERVELAPHGGDRRSARRQCPTPTDPTLSA